MPSHRPIGRVDHFLTGYFSSAGDDAVCPSDNLSLYPRGSGIVYFMEVFEKEGLTFLTF